MVLVDSSVWIKVEHERLKLRELVPADERLGTCPIVVHEVLRGTRDAERYDAARELLLNVAMYDAPTPMERFEQAAQLYLRCRAGGVTPSSGDCLVAACAIAHDLPLLHFDSGFLHIARFTPLRLFSRS